VPSEFDLDNSRAALSRRTDVEGPAVLLSTIGTRLLDGVASCTTVHPACLRNLTAQVRWSVTGRHQRGGGRKGAACLRMGRLLGGRGRLGRRSAVPSAAGAVQDSPDELEAGALTGSRPMALICRRVSPKGPLEHLGVPDPRPLLATGS
jgi:hypothetical protein